MWCGAGIVLIVTRVVCAADVVRLLHLWCVQLVKPVLDVCRVCRLCVCVGATYVEVWVRA